MITTCWNRVRLNGKTSGLRARRSFECAAHAPNKPTPIFVHVSLPLPLGPRLCLQPPTLQMTQFGMPDLTRQVFLECALTLVHMIWFWVWYWFYLIPLLGWCIMLSGVRDILYIRPYSCRLTFSVSKDGVRDGDPFRICGDFPSAIQPKRYCTSPTLPSLIITT